MPSFWEKLWNNLLVRYILILISLLFIVGGALNDGVTGIFFALPFVLFLYFLFSFNGKIKAIVVIIIFLLMIGISQSKNYSPIVYPVIGQTVMVLEDIPLRDWGEDGVFYDYDEQYLNDPDNTKITNSLSIQKGQKLKVKRIIVTQPDFSKSFDFVLSNGERDFRINNTTLGGFIGQTPEEKRQVAFCTKVDWEYCEQIYVLDENTWYHLDPMKPQLRMLTKLMLYPGLPLFLVSKLMSL